MWFWCGCVCITYTMVASVEVPTLKMNNGRQIPAFALGTYLGFDQSGIIQSEDKQMRDAVIHAINVGYRHFDTATIYGTEAEIGEAINMKIQSGDIKREDVFVTTKVWNTHHKREQVIEAIQESLKESNLSYVDLYLMHWPIGLNEDNSISDTDFMETWQGLEDAQRQGLTKSIGVCNFNKTQLERLLNESTIKPSVLQIEIHPQIIQTELVEFAQSQGLVVMGYSPFGSLVIRFGAQQPGPTMNDPTFVEIAKKYGKTTLQVVLRWLLDRNIIPVAKSINHKRMEDNINVFDFTLTDEDAAKINKFNENRRYTLPSFWQNHIYYPFEKVDEPISDTFKSSAKQKQQL